MENQVTEWCSIQAKLPDLCTRKNIAQICNGMIAVQTLANHDSRGTGIEGRFYVGNRTVYPKANVIRWLRQWRNNSSADSDE